MKILIINVSTPIDFELKRSKVRVRVRKTAPICIIFDSSRQGATLKPTRNTSSVLKRNRTLWTRSVRTELSGSTDFGRLDNAHILLNPPSGWRTMGIFDCYLIYVRLLSACDLEPSHLAWWTLAKSLSCNCLTALKGMRCNQCNSYSTTRKYWCYIFNFATHHVAQPSTPSAVLD